jgi:hypothetical protein
MRLPADRRWRDPGSPSTQVSTTPSVTITSTPSPSRRTEKAVPTARTRTRPAETTNGRSASLATWNQASPSPQHDLPRLGLHRHVERGGGVDRHQRAVGEGHATDLAQSGVEALMARGQEYRAAGHAAATAPPARSAGRGGWGAGVRSDRSLDRRRPGRGRDPGS